jgi:hypothetical protein
LTREPALSMQARPGRRAGGPAGRSALVNHPYPIPAQSHAPDMVKLEGGRACVGDPEGLTSYPAFGAAKRAPADKRIVRAVDDHPDMAINQTDAESPVGNHLVIEIGTDKYVMLAHLQLGGIAVDEGQAVRAGGPVGRCGDSGNTSQPHSHLQVLRRPDSEAADLRTDPIVCREVRLARRYTVATGSPRRDDRIITTTNG